MKIVAMIPARLGSQRLKQKNLLKINGNSLVKICAHKCLESEQFNEVYLNSESDLILAEAPDGCLQYLRSPELADSNSTSDDFVRSFLKDVDCDYLFQIHSIAPMITISNIKGFVKSFISSGADVGLCYEKVVLESMTDFVPINFNFNKKQNSQDLVNTQVINWSMTAWKVSDELFSSPSISYGNTRHFYEIDKICGIVIKEKKDYDLCKVILENKVWI